MVFAGSDCRYGHWGYWHGCGGSDGVRDGIERAVGEGGAGITKGSGVEVLGLGVADGHEGGEDLRQDSQQSFSKFRKKSQRKITAIDMYYLIYT